MTRNSIPYTFANIGKRDPQYGGVLTDVSRLPVGTEFLVRNGFWLGRIVSDGGRPAIAVADYASHGRTDQSDGTILGNRILRVVRMAPCGSEDNILAIELIARPST